MSMSDIRDEIAISTVSSFKGLENQIIILIDNSDKSMGHLARSLSRTKKGIKEKLHSLNLQRP